MAGTSARKRRASARGSAAAKALTRRRCADGIAAAAARADSMRRGKNATGWTKGRSVSCGTPLKRAEGQVPCCPTPICFSPSLHAILLLLAGGISEAHSEHVWAAVVLNAGLTASQWHVLHWRPLFDSWHGLLCVALLNLPMRVSTRLNFSPNGISI